MKKLIKIELYNLQLSGKKQIRGDSKEIEFSKSNTSKPYQFSIKDIFLIIQKSY